MNLNWSFSTKKKLPFLISAFVGGLALWFFLSKGLNPKELLNPFMGKVAGTKNVDEAEEKILGATKMVFSSENTQKVLNEGTKILENSFVGESVKTIQETVNQKFTEIIETIKNLPEQEVKRIKKEVCKQWMEEEK